MQAILHDIPAYLIKLTEGLRDRLRDGDFLSRHRVRPEDFTRQCQLSFPVVMLFILQKTIKSIQRHLHEFLSELSGGELFEPVSAGAWTHARAKLKHTAFMELNQECVLPVFYGAEGPEVQRWRGHRLLGVDGSLLRLPNEEELGEAFGWMESCNRAGPTGTRYPEACLSVLYDVLNRCALDAQLESNRRSEISLAMEQLGRLQAGDVVLNDRGFTGYLYLAAVLQHGGQFIARCSTRSFVAAQELFRLERANQSRVVWLFALPQQKAECQRLGLPLKMQVRFISVRLPTGELEVLATSLLDEELYPTDEFLDVYHWRWGHETFHMMLKSRLDLENFSGRTVEAIRQDFHAAVLLCNLESIISQPAEAEVRQANNPQVRPVKLNRAVCYHALKQDLLDLLYRDIPAAEVIAQLTRLFQGAPVPTRPHRKPPKRRKSSLNRSYHHLRRVRKIVF